MIPQAMGAHYFYEIVLYRVPVLLSFVRQAPEGVLLSAQMESRINPSYCKEVRAHPVKFVDGESSQNSIVRILFELVKGARSAHLRPLMRLLIPYINLNSS